MFSGFVDKFLDYILIRWETRLSNCEPDKTGSSNTGLNAGPQTVVAPPSTWEYLRVFSL